METKKGLAGKRWHLYNLSVYKGKWLQKKLVMKLSFKIKKPSGYIFVYLTDMQKFVTVHPVITKIDKTSESNYLVYETLKFAFIPFSFTYPVTIASYPLENIVIMHATVMKSTKIKMTFTLIESGDFTIVEEYILFKSPLPVKLIMQSIFRKQHRQLFKNIENQSMLTSLKDEIMLSTE